ncbi:TetR/AcrR family transcriptional regulator [Pontibacter qinzhouensis]|uniref:TetR/AcrR family transcriptional regulator n=1 Tax=Pontibacter qinzhouensis TaxID=2603253 RepID=A0A5C8K8Y3_9BACT|nr:TetR/AcrR family transcriptional regulator [Pontibacter qinzhouensis]
MKSENQVKIATAAFELFCEQGIKSVSMDDIAQHLAISKKTIYKWYSNKDEVVFAAVKGFLDKMGSDSECCLSNAGNAVAQLFDIMQTVRQLFVSIRPAVFHDLRKYHPRAWKLWQDHKCEFMLEKIKENLRQGIAEGLFRKDLDIEVIARIRLIMVELPFDPHIFPQHEFNLQQVQQANLELYMLGIATLKGHKLINEYKQVKEEE